MDFAGYFHSYPAQMIRVIDFQFKGGDFKMLQPQTFHEYAEQLEILSRDFRDAFTNKSSIDQQSSQKILQESSKKAFDILRTLAIQIRSAMDSGTIPSTPITVGVLKRSATTSEVSATISSYRPPYSGKAGFEPLVLREALNKIAHADPSPSKAGFFADDFVHELILSGKYNSNLWIAIMSIVDLCGAIKSLPDQNVQSV